MLQVLLRVAVWVVVLGVGYLLFGSQLFDSSSSNNPFGVESTIFLPPSKSVRERHYEAISGERALTAEEEAEYRGLERERNAGFWQQQGVSVEEALAGVDSNRKEHLATILQQRGLSSDEISVFLFVVERDAPALLVDRQ